jgi:hypothetical protein
MAHAALQNKCNEIGPRLNAMALAPEKFLPTKYTATATAIATFL